MVSAFQGSGTMGDEVQKPRRRRKKKFPPKGDPRLAVAYLRASKSKQVLSPEAQREAIEKWARREKVTVVAWYTDKVSGGNELEDRPELVRALSEIKALKAGFLVVAKRDRLARDVYAAAGIERALEGAGARVVCAEGSNGETPSDDFMRQILDSAAQYERALIRMRTRAVLEVKKKNGERTGNVLYGFCVVPGSKKLEPYAPEQEVLVRVRALRESGFTIADIQARLEDEGYQSRKGKPFSKGSVENLLRRVA